MDCVKTELLSAYLDRQVNPSEEKRVDLHLTECGRCRASLRLMGRMKASMRSQPLPPMPAELKASLAALVPSRRAKPTGFAAALARVRAAALDAARRPALAYSVAAAAVAVSVFTWNRRPQTAVPVDLLLAAHNQYALTMPLAATERIMSDLPVQISYGGAQDDPHAY